MKKIKNRILLIVCMVLLAGIFSCTNDTFGNGADFTENITKPISAKADPVQTGTPAETETPAQPETPAETEVWEPPFEEIYFQENDGSWVSVYVSVQGLLLKDQLVLCWTPVPEATGYIVWYGTSADYQYSAETTEAILVVPGIDRRQTWYATVQAKKDDKTSALLWPITIEGTEEYAQLELFDPAVLAAQKAAWEAQDITAYRYSATAMFDHMETSLIIREKPVTYTVLPDAQPRLEFSYILADGSKFSYPSESLAHLEKQDFFILAGKTFDDFFASASAKNFAPYEISTSKLAPVGLYTTSITLIQYNETYHFIEYVGSKWAGSFYGGFVKKGNVFQIYEFEVLE